MDKTENRLSSQISQPDGAEMCSPPPPAPDNGAPMSDADFFAAAQQQVGALLEQLGLTLDVQLQWRRDEFGRWYTLAAPVLRRKDSPAGV